MRCPHVVLKPPKNLMPFANLHSPLLDCSGRGKYSTIITHIGFPRGVLVGKGLKLLDFGGVGRDPS